MRPLNPRRFRAVAAAGLLALVAAACGPGGNDAAPTTTGPSVTGPSTPGTTRPPAGQGDTGGVESGGGAPFAGVGSVGRSFGLEGFADCDALLATLRDAVAEQVSTYGWGGPWYGLAKNAEAMPATTVAVSADARGGGAPAPGSSDTNVQEIGVDEADRVETDGRYVFSTVGERLRIVDVTGADGPRLVTTVELPVGSSSLLRLGDRLVAVTQSWANEQGRLWMGSMNRIVPGAAIFPVGVTQTVVSVFDITERAEPALLSRTALDGDLVAARSSDGVVRLVLRTPFTTRLPFVYPSTPEATETAERVNREILDAAGLDALLPRIVELPVSDVSGAGETATRPALACDEVARPATPAGYGTLWVATMAVDAETPTPDGAAAVLASGDVAYATADSLYVATSPWSPWMPRPMPMVVADGGATGSVSASGGPVTDIHAFALDGTAARYVASGEIPGTLLNQFSMSEFGGDLRVAATTDGSWSDAGGATPSSSAVRVLRRNGDTLVQVGALEGLGVTERIHAVRFIGDRAYVVTFRQVDPLYVVDLADPTAPALRGELKIPGFSSYLHPIGDGLLVGVGYDADEATGATTGMQLSLFDVRDPAAPQRIGTLGLGNGWSPAGGDHLAFLWWPDATGGGGRVILPVQNWDDDRPVPFNGAVVATVDPATATVAEAGRVEQTASGDPWSSTIERALVVEGRLVTVSMAGFAAHDLVSLAPLGFAATA